MRSARAVLVLVSFTVGCGAQTDSGLDPAARAALHAEVSALLERSCAKQTCHGDMVSNARLTLMVPDVRTSLVNVPACEYDRMARVAPGDPEQSWIMVKLTAPERFVQYLDFLDFTPAADWQPTHPECSSDLPDGAPWFGTRMPPDDTTQPLDDGEVDVVRRWIEAGAPGPNG